MKPQLFQIANLKIWFILGNSPFAFLVQLINKRAKLSFLLKLTLCPFLATGQEIVCTQSILEDIVIQIIGDEALVSSIVPRGADPHIYEPTPKDLKLLSNASIVFLNGLNLEPWLEKALKNIQFEGPIVHVGHAIDKKKLLHAEKNTYDPHIWMNPLLVLQFTDTIAHVLKKVYPDKTSAIENHLAGYQDSLVALHMQIDSLMRLIPNDQRNIISMHASLNYFAKQYGFSTAALRGFSTEADIRVSDISRISRILKDMPGSVIFQESTINPKILFLLSHDFSVKIGPVLFIDALQNTGEIGDTYLKMMSQNAKNIHRAILEDKHEEPLASLTWSARMYFIIPTSLLLVLCIFVILMSKSQGLMLKQDAKEQS